MGMSVYQTEHGLLREVSRRFLLAKMASSRGTDGSQHQSPG